jgi:hypothetical protein
MAAQCARLHRRRRAELRETRRLRSLPRPRRVQLSVTGVARSVRLARSSARCRRRRRAVFRRPRSARPPADADTLQRGPRPSPSRRNRLPPPAAHSGEAASTALGEVGGAQHPKGASTDGCQRLTRRVTRGQLRRGRDSNPRYGVGDNLKRHATLHANAWKSCSKCFGSLSPLVPVSQRGSSGVGPGLGSGWAASTLAR